MATRSKLAVILHADVVSSTTLVQKDERLAHERIQGAFQQLAQTVASYGGTAHELRGDALVAEFQRASDAVSAALAFQAANRNRNKELADEIRPDVRVGLALGEVVIADQTLTGAGVILAQRLEQLAPPGGIVIQGSIYEAIPRRFPFQYENLGERELKGFDEPIRAVGVALASDSAVPLPEEEQPAPASNDDEEATAVARPSIAVLPFDNLSNDPDQEYFADGVTEDLINVLSRFRWLTVIARSSTFAFKGEQVTPTQIGHDLGVRYVLMGSVRRSGSRIRVNTQLSDVPTGKRVWAERFDRELTDLFELQDEITVSIAGELEPELLASEIERVIRSATGDVEAWDCYMRGMWHLWKHTKSHHADARRWLERALELDPEMGMALSALSWLSLLEVLLGFSNDPERSRGDALALARRAVAADTRNFAAHYAYGRALVMGGDVESGIDELKRAVELNPSSSWAHFGLGHSLVHADHPEEALPHLEKALQLSPHDPTRWAVYLAMAVAHANSGRAEAAVECDEHSVRIDSDQWIPLTHLAVCLRETGRNEHAEVMLNRAKKLIPELQLNWVDQRMPIPGSRSALYLVDGLRKLGIPE